MPNWCMARLFLFSKKLPGAKHLGAHDVFADFPRLEGP